MKDIANNVALGLGVAVLGFAVYKYFRTSGSNAGAAAVASNPNSGALWQQITFPLGSPSGGVNMTGGLDQVYSSGSWNPDSLSAQLGLDTIAAMGAAGQSTLNQYGFHV